MAKTRYGLGGSMMAYAGFEAKSEGGEVDVADFEDLTTAFVAYMATLRAVDTVTATNEDMNTLIVLDLPTVVAAGSNDDDANTNYAEVLTP